MEQYLRLRESIIKYLEAEDAVDPVHPTEAQSQAVMDAYTELKDILEI